MEHTLSASTLERLADFMAFIQECPRAGENWLHHFEAFRMHGQRPDNCIACNESFFLRSDQAERTGQDCKRRKRHKGLKEKIGLNA
jgi:hypothetical protein